MKKQFLRIVLVLLNTLLSSCLAIRDIPLDQADFYRTTIAGIDQASPLLPASTSPAVLLAGAAKVPLPLTPGLPMAGYGKRIWTAKEIHEPLFARALALKLGEERALLISVDLLAVTDEMRNAVLQKIEAKRPFPSHALMLSATHTHSGPGALSSGFLEQFAAGPFDRDFFEKTTAAIADAALLALDVMKPARISHGIAAAPEWIHNRMNPSGPVDPQVHFVEFLGEVGQPIAMVVNFSAHATVLKPDNLAFSGDYPGFFEAALEEQGGVVLFTAGSVADQTAHPPEGSDPFQRAEGMGRGLARKVRESPHTLPEVVSTLSAQTLSIRLPPPQVKVGRNRRLATLITAPFFDSETILQTIRIGPIVLIGVPADLSVILGEKVKAHARERGMEAIIVGFANDYIGYLLPRDLYWTDAYEARVSFHGPQMGEYLVEIAERLIDRASGPRPLSPALPEAIGRGVSQ